MGQYLHHIHKKKKLSQPKDNDYDNNKIIEYAIDSQRTFNKTE